MTRGFSGRRFSIGGSFPAFTRLARLGASLYDLGETGAAAAVGVLSTSFGAAWAGAAAVGADVGWATAWVGGAADELLGGVAAAGLAGDELLLPPQAITVALVAASATRVRKRRRSTLERGIGLLSSAEEYFRWLGPSRQVRPPIEQSALFS